MNDRDWKIGGAAGVGGLVLGLLLGPGSGDFSALETRIDESAVSVQAAATEGANQLTGRIDGIDTALAGLAERLSAMETASEAQIGSVAATIENGVADLHAGITGIQSTMDERHAAMDARHAVMPKHDAGDDAAADAAPAPAPEIAALETVAVGPGETAIFGDGEGRVFVSSVAADGQSARIAVNGLDLITVPVGYSVRVGSCAVTLSSIADGRVAFGSAC